MLFNNLLLSCAPPSLDKLSRETFLRIFFEDSKISKSGSEANDSDIYDWKNLLIDNWRTFRSRVADSSKNLVTISFFNSPPIRSVSHLPLFLHFSCPWMFVKPACDSHHAQIVNIYLNVFCAWLSYQVIYTRLYKEVLFNLARLLFNSTASHEFTLMKLHQL